MRFDWLLAIRGKCQPNLANDGKILTNVGNNRLERTHVQ